MLEDGKPVEITHFASIEPAAANSPAPAAPAAPREAVAPPSATPAEGGTHLLVYVDDQHLWPARRRRVLRQVGDFANAHLLPADRVSVVSDDLGLKLRLPFSTDRAALGRVLAEIEATPAAGVDTGLARRSAFETMMNEQEVHAKQGGYCGSSVAAHVRDYAKAMRADALRTLGRLRFVVNSLAGVTGRKALLLVTDGIPLNQGEELAQAFFGLCGGGAAREGVYIRDEALSCRLAGLLQARQRQRRCPRRAVLFDRRGAAALGGPRQRSGGQPLYPAGERPAGGRRRQPGA